MSVVNTENIRMCLGCPSYVPLNPHHIVDGLPYWGCDKGYHPLWCKERRKRQVEERLDRMIADAIDKGEG